MKYATKDALAWLERNITESLCPHSHLRFLAHYAADKLDAEDLAEPAVALRAAATAYPRDANALVAAVVMARDADQRRSALRAVDAHLEQEYELRTDLGDQEVA